MATNISFILSILFSALITSLELMAPLGYAACSEGLNKGSNYSESVKSGWMLTNQETVWLSLLLSSDTDNISFRLSP